MFAFLFQCIGNLKKFFLCHPICRKKICHLWFSTCDCSSLVQCDNFCFPGLFQRNCRFKQNSMFCTHSVSDHDRHRSRKAKRTWAADDKHCNSPCQCKANTLSCQKPYSDSDRRNRHDDRDKHARHFICYFGDWSLCRCRITDHLNDLGKRRIFADSCGLTFQETRLIHRRSRHQISFFFICRDAFSCERCLIHRTVPFKHNAIYRYIFTGSYKKYISLFYLFNGNRFFCSVVQHNCMFRCKAHQPFECICSLPFGSGLKHLSDCDERQDHCG